MGAAGSRFTMGARWRRCGRLPFIHRTEPVLFASAMKIRRFRTVIGIFWKNRSAKRRRNSCIPTSTDGRCHWKSDPDRRFFAPISLRRRPYSLMQGIRTCFRFVHFCTGSFDFLEMIFVVSCEDVSGKRNKTEI